MAAFWQGDGAQRGWLLLRSTVHFGPRGCAKRADNRTSMNRLAVVNDRVLLRLMCGKMLEDCARMASSTAGVSASRRKHEPHSNKNSDLVMCTNDECAALKLIHAWAPFQLLRRAAWRGSAPELIAA